MITVALATAVSTLPRAPGLAYEPKFDGHRLVVVRTVEDVVLQARSGRIVTAAFPDLAAAARQLPAGTVLDGEVVVWHEGRTDFALVQRRAAATPVRAAVLAQSLPASYAAFDVLELAGLDVRARPYERRRALLVDLLLPLGPPLQPVPMTTDPELAATWYETLPASGIEGLVVKRLDQSYPAGRRGWRKLRHTDVRDAAVVGYTGSPRKPVALVLVLPVGDETPLVSSPLTAALRAELAAAVAERATGGAATGAAAPGATAPGGTARGGTVTAIGLGEVPFRPLDPPLTAEVRHTSARHPPPEVLRLRTDL
ncbi:MULTISPECIES: ATP-dependent DNA ligase [unclassified Streptomyces]|uniref:ATP-dependent DNA ligase n=1 Tax=unclassified Streptomyces TaxID=2593676 RepID=UPI0022546F5E|nr:MULTISPECIES: ATP-dependent DNA ligase [unclassified Streptomyces]MCX4528074.1 ATP-dependent DNA ligase [Streptomyces sp. NBC_01551]MCX4541311.1 ATP-dependent DNA ligase [Streptomyces sp. NBC_01565]